MAGERMIKAMQNAAAGSVDVPRIVRGSVTSISPLVITVESGLALTDQFLILSPFCRKKSILKSAITQTGDSEIVEILAWQGLQINDPVVMVKYGRVYHVLQREGEY